MTIRHVHVKLEQELWERASQAAKADRRSLTNWIAVLVERALEDKSRDAADQPVRPALFQPPVAGGCRYQSAMSRGVKVIDLHTPTR